ncbi:MAG: XTP/dITP diphosphatase [Smithellaceae bacterium]|nr:XTP/dITP diphosphatase [Smithellaceae bacterium]
MASRNKGKIKELGALTEGLPIEIKSLADYDPQVEIIEDGLTFLENALKKASAAARLTGEIALADDSGLEVDFLRGAPGVNSARYAGPGATDELNFRKLLREMEGVPPEYRGACFVCTLVLYHPDGTYQSFNGAWRGVITEEPRGDYGFGYDPVFFLPELRKTAAELPTLIKNRLSHRATAMNKLIKALSDY